LGVYFYCQLTDTILYHSDYSCNVVCQHAYILNICLLIEVWYILYPLFILDLYWIHLNIIIYHSVLQSWVITEAFCCKNAYWYSSLSVSQMHYIMCSIIFKQCSVIGSLKSEILKYFCCWSHLSLIITD
jgi:hypothetical protein